ncbi:hypothetical protein EYC84_002735 [Monilinia fructicola]|uniref:Uncharacterized protein n=1 Tax=Monilinia fructicola TaxID=38448 RepID=A0A5M9JPX6_MONFR|nr:hypothetical protein EYC84_002735 [Monilinia fructicola]
MRCCKVWHQSIPQDRQRGKIRTSWTWELCLSLVDLKIPALQEIDGSICLATVSTVGCLTSEWSIVSKEVKMLEKPRGLMLAPREYLLLLYNGEGIEWL